MLYLVPKVAKQDVVQVSYGPILFLLLQDCVNCVVQCPQPHLLRFASIAETKSFTSRVRYGSATRGKPGPCQGFAAGQRTHPPPGQATWPLAVPPHLASTDRLVCLEGAHHHLHVRKGTLLLLRSQNWTLRRRCGWRIWYYSVFKGYKTVALIGVRGAPVPKQTTMGSTDVVRAGPTAR